MTTAKTLTADNRQFSLAAPLRFSEDTPNGQAKRKRTFSGVAYSGEVIVGHWYWDNVVFDLSTMSVPDKLPALVDHDRAQRAGFVTSSDISNETGFTVSGTLLSNKAGESVAGESDEGFPWQMSVHINPGSIEEVGPGTTVFVNGRELPGPLTVFRNSTLSEVSFTATGWDANTSAAAMSRGGTNPQPPEGNDMDLKEALAKLATAEADNATLKASNTQLTADVTAANAKLAQFSQDARTAAVKQLYADVGREYKADDADVVAFSKMSQEGFDATAKVLRDFGKTNAPAAPTLPAGLFSHAQGTTPTPTDPAAAAAAANPLLANAKDRATEFSKRKA